MRRALLAAATLGSAVLAAGCQLPPRDNPHDPDNLLPDPVVDLQVTTTAGGVTSIQSFARRNVGFFLNATGSFDPEGRDLSFEWDLDRQGDYESPGTPLPYVNLTSGNSVAFVIPQVTAIDFPSGVGATVVNLRLRVTAGANVVERAIDLAVTNEAPRINTGEEIVVPAALGPIVLLDPCGGADDCTSKDPDGDALIDFEWKQVPPETVAMTVLDSQGHWSFTAPNEPGVLVFELTASDGITSSSGRQIVRIGPQAWARTDDRLYRLHTEERVSTNFSIANADLDEVFVEPLSGEYWVAGESGAGGTEVRRVAEDGVTVLGSWFAGDNSPNSISASGTTGWLAHENGFTRLPQGAPAATMTTSPPFDVGNDRGSTVSPDGQWFLSRKTLYRDSGNGIPTQVVNIPGGNEVLPTEMTVDADGNPWIAAQNGVFRLLGNSLQIRYTDAVDAIFAHPETGVWLVERGDEIIDIKHLHPTGYVEVAATLFGGTSDEDCQIVYEEVSETLWLLDGIELFRFRYRDGFLDAPERFDWENELLITNSNLPYFRSMWPNPLRASLALTLDVLDFGGNPTGLGRLASVHPELEGPSIVPGFTPQATFIGVTHKLSIDPTRGVWAKERFGDVTHIAASGIRLSDDAFDGAGIIGPFSKLDGGAYGISYSQFDQGLDLLEVAPDGSPIGTVNLTPTHETFEYSFAGNENGICLVGGVAFSTGSPLRVSNAAGTLTDYASTVTWDGFDVDDVAISPDGGTCWFAETSIAFGNRIITASGTTAARSGALAQPTTTLAADPRPAGGVWRVDANNAITRFAGGAGSVTPIATPVTALAIEKVCESAATASCVNVWYAVPGFVVRARSDGTIISQYKVAGRIDDLAVR